MSTRIRLWRRTACVAVCGVVLSGCGNDNSVACEDAAVSQARAESDWSDALQAHNVAHTESIEHDAHDELTALRVDLIIAEAEVRSSCG